MRCFQRPVLPRRSPLQELQNGPIIPICRYHIALREPPAVCRQVVREADEVGRKRDLKDKITFFQRRRGHIVYNAHLRNYTVHLLNVFMGPCNSGIGLSGLFFWRWRRQRQLPEKRCSGPWISIQQIEQQGGSSPR